MSGSNDKSAGADICSARMAQLGGVLDGVAGGSFYQCVYTEPPPHLAAEFIALRAELARCEAAPWWDVVSLARVPLLHARLAAIPQQELWRGSIENVWCLEGMQALLTHARLAAMDIAKASADAPVAPVLDELAEATRRAATLLDWVRRG